MQGREERQASGAGDLVEDDLYEGGLSGLQNWHLSKRTPFSGVEAVLPAANVDLEALRAEIVPRRESEPAEHPGNSARRKEVALQKLFEGQSRLLLLHALLIAILRRTDPPEEAVALFLRIWREQGTFMAQNLNARWMISAATTFADFGTTANQRALGMGLSVMFDMMKLHDSERRLSGQSGRKPFDRTPGWRNTPLAFDLDPYSLKGGDLDKNMLARLWNLSQAEPVMRPLGEAMLGLVMKDRHTIFARMQRIKLRNGAMRFLDRLRGEG